MSATTRLLVDMSALQGKMRMARFHIGVYEDEITKTLDSLRRLHTKGDQLTIALIRKRLDAQREWVRTYEYVAKTTLKSIMVRKRKLYELGWKG